MTKPLDELFAEAIVISAGPRREAWFEVAVGSNTSLRRELDELIRAHEAVPETFLKTDASPGEGREPPDPDGPSRSGT